MAERIVPKSIQKFDSHVKFFLLVVSFQTASASCLLSETSYTSVLAILKFMLTSDVLGSSLFEISKCWENE